MSGEKDHRENSSSSSIEEETVASDSKLSISQESDNPMGNVNDSDASNKNQADQGSGSAQQNGETNQDDASQDDPTATSISGPNVATSATELQQPEDSGDKLEEEETLQEIYTFLSSPRLREDKLIEDEVLVAMHRMHKTALQRARSFRALGNSAEGEDELYTQCLEDVEDQTLADELFQDLMQHMEEKYYDNDKSSASTQKKSMDRRTMSWVKKIIGVGFRKKSMPSRFDELLVAPNAGRRTTRRKISKPARYAKKNRGVDELFDAVKDLEDERGEAFRHIRPVRRRSLSPVYQADDETSAKENKRRKTSHDTKKKKDSRRRGSNDDGDERPTKRTKVVPVGPPKIDLVALQRQLDSAKIPELASRKPNHISHHKRAKLPQVYQDMGIIHRLPRWEKFGKTLMVPGCSDLQPAPVKTNGRKLPPLAVRHAICSSFVSDLDRPWLEQAWKSCQQDFSRQVFVATAGWKVRRKRLERSTRGLTKKFLADEIAERNDYRQGARLIQSSPELKESIDYPFNVPAPFTKDTPVVVPHCSREMVVSAVVVKYVVEKSEYLLAFDRRDLGCAFYPDTDIASRWACDLGSVSKAETRREAFVTVSLPLGSNSVKVEEKLKNAAKFRAITYGTCEPKEETNDDLDSPDAARNAVAERESLVTVMDSVEIILTRLEDLVKALRIQTDATSANSNGVHPVASPPSHTASHILWLEHCIREGFLARDKLLLYLESLYGDIFLPEGHPKRRLSSLTKTHVMRLMDQIAKHPIDSTTSSFVATLTKHVETHVSKLPSKKPINSSLHNAMTELLMATAFAANLADGKLAVAVSASTIQRAEEVQKPLEYGGEKDGFLAQVQHEREDAAQELLQALKMFQSEVALSKFVGD